MDATVPSTNANDSRFTAGHGSCNVGETERWISMFAAGALVAGGLLRGSLSLVALGGALAYRGYTGHCHVYQALEYSSAESGEQPSRLIVRE
jgi:uncharacterized membrane protein